MSLLFDVFNAVTGTREAPAEHNMPPLCRLVYLAIANRANNDSRIYEYGAERIELDTGLNAATVRKCMRDLVEHGRLLPLGWSGPRNNAVRVYEVRTAGAPWELPKSKARETPTARRARLATPPDGTAKSAPPPDGGPEAHRMAPRAATGWHPAPPPDGDKPPSNLPENHKENLPRESAQARDHAREDPQGVGQAIPFGPSEVTTPPEATAIPPGTVLPLFPTDPTTTPLPASSTRRKADAPGAAEQVHEAYCAAREKADLKGRPPVLDAKRRKLVAARLKDGFTVEDLCAAARGVWASEWHREQGQTSLDLVLRDSAHVERFREEAARRGDRVSLGAADDEPEPTPWRAPRPPPPVFKPHVPDAEELELRAIQARAEERFRAAREAERAHG